jgi:hypothetical protein
MVTYQGVTKVFDFGIARIQEDSQQSETPGGGKFAYMSPEQCRDEPVDARSDVFSLGIILYELTSGRRLFRRETPPEVIRAVTEEPIAWPGQFIAGFPAELEAIIKRALERNPARRYQRAAQMRDDLLGFLSTRADGGLRRQLGRYVADLFVAEREDIARTMRDAYERGLKPKPIGAIPLEMLGHVEGDAVEAPPNEEEPPALEHAQDTLARDGGNPLPETAAADRSTIIEAKRKNNNLVAEVRRLQKRQNVLVVLLLIISLMAASAVVISRIAANPLSQIGDGEPIEIGSP